MPTIRKQVLIDATAAEVWDAVRDFYALHERLVPGFATSLERDGDDRLVTFFTGNVLRERPIDVDDDERRLAWTIVDGPYAHHNGVAEVHDVAGRASFVWTTDLLADDEVVQRTEAMMQRGVEVARETLERATKAG